MHHDQYHINRPAEYVHPRRPDRHCIQPVTDGQTPKKRQENKGPLDHISNESINMTEGWGCVSIERFVAILVLDDDSLLGNDL